MKSAQHKQERLTRTGELLAIESGLLNTTVQIIATQSPELVPNGDALAQRACDLAHTIAVEFHRRAQKRLAEAAK